MTSDLADGQIDHCVTDTLILGRDFFIAQIEIGESLSLKPWLEIFECFVGLEPNFEDHWVTILQVLVFISEGMLSL